MNRFVSTSVGLLVIAIIAGIFALAMWSFREYAAEAPAPPSQKAQVNSLKGAMGNQNVTQSASEASTADWKTYENKTYKFRLQYPPIYKFLENKISDAPRFDLEGTSIFMLQLGMKIGEGETPAYVMVFKNFSQKEPLREPAGTDPASSVDATVGGLKAKKYDTGDGGVVYVVANKGFRYEIGYVEVTSAAEKENFPKILQTFQFSN